MPDSLPEIRIKSYNECLLIQFFHLRELDLYNARDLERLFKLKNQEGCSDYIIDLAPIQYIDSSGLGILAAQGSVLQKKSKKLKLISISNSVAHIFRVSGFERLFEIYPNISHI